jgi:hypothetical protein
MPLPRHIREELERKRVEEHRLASRDSFWANLRTAVMCVVWSGVGLACMAWGLHTTDHGLGQIAWKGGVVVGYAGILFTLMRWHAKAKHRGDA